MVCDVGQEVIPTVTLPIRMKNTNFFTVATVAENAEIAAHYSQISAFYAKRNAELTDALGYLIAFK